MRLRGGVSATVRGRRWGGYSKPLFRPSEEELGDGELGFVGRLGGSLR
jgi:hypothetical protein